MWIANLAVVLIITGCAAYQYLKGNFINSFVTTIFTICASVVAFGYFEILANVFISRSDNSRLSALVPWAQPLSFALLFILAFSILQTIAGQLTRRPVVLGPLPERIGRVVCGIFLGVIISGLLLTVLAMAPLPNQYPYQRFEARRPDAEKPNKLKLNADGFATGWFSMVSRGSLSGKRSFATLHPAFLDQAFLNRHSAADGISITTSSNAIELPRKKAKKKAVAAWPAPENLKDSNGRPIPPKSGHNLIIARVGIKKKALEDAGKFTLSQLRLICKEKGYAKKPLAGKGKNTYPLGYLTAANQLQIKRLNDVITVKYSDFEKKATVRWIDFAFYVPNDSVPVLVEFKQNSIAQVPRLAAADEAPPPVPFIQPSDSKKDSDTKSGR
jgi:hypothetical protein